MRTAIYVRQSKDKDSDGASVARQRVECEALAAANGWTVVETFEDNDVSATTGKRRPAFEAMLKAAESGQLDRIVVWRIDRLYRKLADLVTITEKLRDVPIVTVMSGRIDLSTADGRLHANMLGAVAQHEGEAKAERIALKFEQRAREGRALGSRRQFGWAWAHPCPGGQDCRHSTPCTVAGERPAAGTAGAGMIPHPVEGALVVEAYRQLLEGASIRAICRWLSDQPGGRAMSPTPLVRILKNPRNAGLVKHRGSVVADRADGSRLVERETWDAAQVILGDPARKMAPGRPTSTLLGGLLRCPCGGRMSASRKNGHDTYQCAAEGHSYNRRRALLDGPLLSLFGEVVAGLDAAGLLEPTPEASTDPTEAERARLEALRSRYRQQMLDGLLDPDEHDAMVSDIRARLKVLGSKQSRTEGRRASLSGIKAWPVLVERNDVSALRAIIVELVEHIELLPAATYRKPAPSDVRIEWASWIPHRELLPTAPA